MSGQDSSALAFTGHLGQAARLSDHAASLAEQAGRKGSRRADDLEKRLPQDTNMRFHYLPPVQAFLALNENQAAQAIDILRAGAPYGLGSPPGSFYSCFHGALYAKYVRGCACLTLHRGAEGAAEFATLSIIPVSRGVTRLVCWRTCSLAGPMLRRETRRPRRLAISTFCAYGRRQFLTSPFSKWRKVS